MIPIEENSASESEIATWNFMCVLNYFTLHVCFKLFYFLNYKGKQIALLSPH